MLNGCLLIILGGLKLHQELGLFAWLAIGFGVYGGIIFGGFAFFPHQLPAWIEFLCFGNMQEEYYHLVWSARRDLCPDVIDRTWILPMLLAVVEIAGFSGLL